MKIHLIAMGGSIMHNLAIALQQNGHEVSGSDDEIYEPARRRLAAHGLLPEVTGWQPALIHKGLDMVILGMHARKDNPELVKALSLGLRVLSFPEFIYEHAAQKKRIVVAGSHGKTTTTSMVMHVLKYAGVDFDYLVGASVEGFDTMVRLSDAPLMVIEGDEYLSSCLDSQPKFLHYLPDVAVVTGIAWDHINVFPTYESYENQFRHFVSSIDNQGTLIAYNNDAALMKIISEVSVPTKILTYHTPRHLVKDGHFYLYNKENELIKLQILGEHNLQNLEAAGIACFSVGISYETFLKAIPSFKGASKRLQRLGGNENFDAYLDFAHAPSKVRATTAALRQAFPERALMACLELHTFSSLSKDFLPHYANTLNEADEAVVYFDEHTLNMKKMPAIYEKEVLVAFGHGNLKVVTKLADFEKILLKGKWHNRNLLLMSSGNFGGFDAQKFVKEVSEKTSC